MHQLKKYTKKKTKTKHVTGWQLEEAFIDQKKQEALQRQEEEKRKERERLDEMKRREQERILEVYMFSVLFGKFKKSVQNNSKSYITCESEVLRN